MKFLTDISTILLIVSFMLAGFFVGFLIVHNKKHENEKKKEIRKA
jgi:uncharacterized protein YneF (UPF0154 family)